MNLIVKSVSTLALCFSLATAFATPDSLTTHNNTNEESNAYLIDSTGGLHPSVHPTGANSTNSVPWPMVIVACLPYSKNNKCNALIRMATDTANPIDVGRVTLNLDTGEITPSSLTSGKYKINVSNGVTTIDYNG